MRYLCEKILRGGYSEKNQGNLEVIKLGYRDNFFKDSKNKSNHGWYTCVGCGKKLRKGDATIDHIIPQSCGGGHGMDNLQCMCRSCNSSKGNNMNNSLSDYINNDTRRNRTISNKEMKELKKVINSGRKKSLKDWLKK